MTLSQDPMWHLGQEIGEAQNEVYERWKALHPVRGRAQFLLRASAQTRTGRSGVQQLGRWAAASSVAAIAVATVMWFSFMGTTLTFDVGSQAGVEQAWIAAPESDRVALRFSDGSTVDLEPESRARVLDLRPHGARVVLETGAAEVHVEPHDLNDWTIDAGPYRVEVVGTAFRVQWDAAHEVFDLKLHHGQVKVTGPDLPEARFVRGGERFEIHASTGTGEVVGMAIVPEPAADVRTAEPADDDALALRVPEEDDPPAVHGDARSAGRRPRTRTVTAGDPDWLVLYKQGDYRNALARANALGFDRLCETLPARQLLDLADTARFAHDRKRARQALTTARRRFVGTEAAALAAFDLGRIAQRDCNEASRWFKVYLREQPRGSMVEVAKSRLDECSRQHQ